MRRLRSLLMVTFCLISAPVFSQSGVFVDGEKLVSACRNYLIGVRDQSRLVGQIALDYGYCYGVIVGVHDAAAATNAFSRPPFNLPQVCIPERVNAHTLTEIVATALDRDPAGRNYTIMQIALRAWGNAYPCRR